MKGEKNCHPLVWCQDPRQLPYGALNPLSKIHCCPEIHWIWKECPSLMREGQGRLPQGLLSPCLWFLWEGQFHPSLSCLIARNGNSLKQAKAMEWYSAKKMNELSVHNYMMNSACRMLSKIPETDIFCTLVFCLHKNAICSVTTEVRPL